MALSHFLRPESALHIRRNGFSTTMRWLSQTHPVSESDTEMATPLKKTTPQKLRPEKMESFIRKYMESNSGKFPTPSHIQRELGGSYYRVKEILSTFKEKTLGKQPRNDQNPNLPTPIVNQLASSLEQNSQVDNAIRPEADFNSNKEQNIVNTSDNAVKESSLTPVAGKPDSNVTAVHVPSSSAKLRGNGDQPEQKVRVSKSDFPDHSREIGILSRMFRGETYDRTAVQSNKRLQSNVVPSGVSPASKLSTFHKPAPSNSSRKLPRLIEPSRLDFLVSGNHLSEDENATTQSKFVPNVAKLFSGSNTPVEGKRMSNDQASDRGKTRVTSSHSVDNDQASDRGNTRVTSSHSVDNHQSSDQGNTRVTSSHLVDNLKDRTDEKQKKEPKFFDIKYLIGCIKEMPITESLSEPSNDISTLQNDFLEERKTSSKFNFVHTDDELEEPSGNAPANSKTCDEESTSPEYVSQKISEQPSASDDVSNDVPNENSGAFKVVVKFLPEHVQEKDIHDHLQSCGDISSIEYPIVEGATFNHAFVYFKTEEGLKNALKKHVVYMGNKTIPIEAADAVVNGTSKRICIPDLIGDPDFPTALGKNPTRTVMITPLTHDISRSHVQSSLSFCGGKITGFFLGSSKSVAYVELETEEAKERALAKHTIDLLGKKVMIHRIDIPRTTVIRIFHPNPKLEDIKKYYNSVGKVRSVRRRSVNITDVYYNYPEWPNMQNILNRLNGVQVDGHPIVAQPATVIPPEILSVLWAQPDGRKHVVSMIQSFLHKANEETIVQKSKILFENFYGAER